MNNIKIIMLIILIAGTIAGILTFIIGAIAMGNNMILILNIILFVLSLFIFIPILRKMKEEINNK